LAVLSSCRVTLGIVAAALAAFILFGAGPLDIEPKTGTGIYAEALMNAFRHGDVPHLFGNLLFIFWAGTYVEPRFGARLTLALAVGAIILGTGLQVLFVGGNFLGLSGVAYCFAICAFMLHAGMAGAIFILLAGLIIVGVQMFYMSDKIAVFAHLGGIIVGGGWSMFQKIFGQKASKPEDPEQPYIAPLQAKHIDRIVEIINETDDDDAEDADETLRERGCDGMYALWHQNRIIGVTGYAPTEASGDVVWLSWTYLERAARGRALGRFMMDELLRILNDKKVRKIFIATSDYKEDGEDVYADARKFYESLGAKLEVTLPGFYSSEESKLIYGLVNPGAGKPESLEDLGTRGVNFRGVVIYPTRLRRSLKVRILSVLEYLKTIMH